MKRANFCMAILIASILLVGPAWAEEKQPAQNPRIEIELVDGSRVIGILGLESVSLQTSYAKMEIAVQHILAIKMAEDHETASIDLRNGDHLKGAVHLESIELDTLFGKISVDLEHVREFRVVLAGETLPDALRNGLVLHYSFDRDEAGVIKDLSGGNNHGTVVEGAKWVKEGRRGGGYRIPGGRGRIEVDDSPVFSLKTNDDRTFCLWWKKDGNIGHRVLLSKWSQANNGFGFSLLTLPSEGVYYMPFQVHHWAKYSAALSDDNWNHVAVVKTGTSYKLYHNGQEALLVASMGWPMTVDMTVRKPLEIGGTHMREDFGFEGFVDEVMVYNRGLSAGEVQQIYDAQK